MPTILSYRPLEPEKAHAVAIDGLPRIARYVEVYTDEKSHETFGAEILHVLYLPEGAALPHSMLAKDWAGALPTDPTPAESAAAIQARETERENKKAATALRRQRVLALAADAVGEPIDRLSPRQLGAILAILHPDLVDDALEIRPLAEWAG